MDRVYCYCIVASLVLFGACFERRDKDSSECPDNICILKYCPDYKAEVNESDESSSVCNNNGTCFLRNMPLYSQLNSNIPAGEIACGPTAVSMAMDSAVKNSTQSVTGWSKNFSLINAQNDPTGSSDSLCPAYDIECKKIVAAGTELISETWADSSAYEVYSREINDFWANRKTEFSNSENYDTGDFPNTLSKCSFITGEMSITNTTPWVNILLYLKYPSTVTQTSKTESGMPISHISISSESITGHYITLNGYDATGKDLFFKFHDPTLGLKWYGIREAEVGKTQCVQWTGETCTQYIVINSIPEYFEQKITYLVEVRGEEAKNGYQFRLVANIGGFKP
ncbi:MAG: hypothetical protein JXA66_04575 [Oligoflexia bacterium]|nr:hypothetical protein [Oligoflexia bacterium]